MGTLEARQAADFAICRAGLGSLAGHRWHSVLWVLGAGAVNISGRGGCMMFAEAKLLLSLRHSVPQLPCACGRWFA